MNFKKLQSQSARPFGREIRTWLIGFFIFILAGFLAASFSSLFAQTWTEPSATPPGSNVSAPINVSDLYQTKSGALQINGSSTNWKGMGVGKSVLTLGSGENLIYGRIHGNSHERSNFLLLQNSGLTKTDRFRVDSRARVFIGDRLQIMPDGISHFERFQARKASATINKPAIIYQVLLGFCQPTTAKGGVNGVDCDSAEKEKLELISADAHFSCATRKHCYKDAPLCSTLGDNWLEETVGYDDCCQTKYAAKRVCYKKVDYSAPALSAVGSTWRQKLAFYSEPCTVSKTADVWPEQCQGVSADLAPAKDEILSVTEVYDNLKVKRDAFIGGSSLVINPEVQGGLKITPFNISKWERFQTGTGPIYTYKILEGICRRLKPGETRGLDATCGQPMPGEEQVRFTPHSGLALKTKLQNLLAKIFPQVKAAQQVRRDELVLCIDDTRWCKLDPPDCESLNIDGETGWEMAMSVEDKCCGFDYIKRRVCKKGISQGQSGFMWRPKISFSTKPLCEKCDESTSLVNIHGVLRVTRGKAEAGGGDLVVESRALIGAGMHGDLLGHPYTYYPLSIRGPLQLLDVTSPPEIPPAGGAIYYDGTNLKCNEGGSAWVNCITPGGTPAGSSGAVQFNAAGSFGGDAANFFWDNTTKRLGIGTASPGAKLEVVSALQNSLRLKKTPDAAGSVELFPAVGNIISRSGTELCQTVVKSAICLGHWTSAGDASDCATPLKSSRALCADFGD